MFLYNLTACQKRQLTEWEQRAGMWWKLQRFSYNDPWNYCEMILRPDVEDIRYCRKENWLLALHQRISREQNRGTGDDRQVLVLEHMHKFNTQWRPQVHYWSVNPQFSRAGGKREHNSTATKTSCMRRCCFGRGHSEKRLKSLKFEFAQSRNSTRAHRADAINSTPQTEQEQQKNLHRASPGTCSSSICILTSWGILNLAGFKGTGC